MTVGTLQALFPGLRQKRAKWSSMELCHIIGLTTRHTKNLTFAMEHALNWNQWSCGWMLKQATATAKHAEKGVYFERENIWKCLVQFDLFPGTTSKETAWQEQNLTDTQRGSSTRLNKWFLENNLKVMNPPVPPMTAVPGGNYWNYKATFDIFKLPSTLWTFCMKIRAT